MTIIICLPGNNFSGNFLDCFSETLAYFHDKGWKYFISRRESSNVYHVRSMCLGADVLRGKNQKPFDGKIEYDWILWIDSDMVWHPSQIEKLFNTKGDIVTGLYLTADRKHYTVVEELDHSHFLNNGRFKFLSNDDLRAIKYKFPFNIQYAGMGFMAIRYGVFENIQYPWFEGKMVDFGNDIVEFTSEDVGFCMKAIEAGYNIVANPDIKVGHEKRFVI